jgi:hypothetical protein
MLEAEVRMSASQFSPKLRRTQIQLKSGVSCRTFSLCAKVAKYKYYQAPVAAGREHLEECATYTLNTLRPDKVGFASASADCTQNDIGKVKPGASDVRCPTADIDVGCRTTLAFKAEAWESS